MDQFIVITFFVVFSGRTVVPLLAGTAKSPSLTEEEKHAAH
jgi:hypothetical protein